MATEDTALLGLMRLVSPALPVGGFAYSQGLEFAIENGWVTNSEAVKGWLSGVLREGLGRLDIPLLSHTYQCLGDDELFSQWNQKVLASRETKELRLEELQMGKALWRLLGDMNHPLPETKNPTWLGAFAQAGYLWGLENRQTCLGFLWTWMENQLAVAAKTVPIGQTDVQRISAELLPLLADVVDEGMGLDENEIFGGLPGVVMASMKHETQYSRLFRS